MARRKARQRISYGEPRQAAPRRLSSVKETRTMLIWDCSSTARKLAWRPSSGRQRLSS